MRSQAVMRVAFGAWFAVVVGCGSGGTAFVTPSDAGKSDGGVADASIDAAFDSPDSPDSQCAADLTSDPQNCGACGHDCLGASCSGSICQPITLAQSLVYPTAIALDATTIYFTQAGEADGGVVATKSIVGKVGKAGGAPVVLATETLSAGIAVDATHVYFGGEKGILRVPIGGGPVTTVANNVSALSYGVRALIIDAVDVYWTAVDGTVQRAPKTGGIAQPIASGGFTLAVDGKNVYLTTLGREVASVPLGGGTVTPFEKFPITFMPYGIAVDATDVYVTVEGNPGSVRKYDLATKAPSVVIGSQDVPSAIAIDAASVFWATSTAIQKIPKGGGQLVPLAKLPAFTSVGTLATDDEALYWTNTGTSPKYVNGALMKVAK